MILADISIQNSGWSEVFFLLAVLVSIVGILITIAKVPYLWLVACVWAVLLSLGLLYL